VSHTLGDDAAADKYLATAAPIIDVSTGTNSPEALRLRALRGQIAATRGQLVEARADLSAATGAKSVYLRMVALRERAELSLKEGELAAAEKDANESLRLAQAAQGGVPYSSRTGQAWEILGRIFANRGDTARAHRAFETAVQHLSNTVDARHPVLLRARQLASST
jgi:tetratricopeptide (TPR) repeat protein